MAKKLPAWSRALSLALGIALGYFAYSQFTLDGVLRRLNPDLTPVGREYNDGVAIRELFREIEGDDPLVFYIVGGSSAARGVDEALFAFELSQLLGRDVEARNLGTRLQGIIDSDAFLSNLPPPRQDRSFVIYTWAGMRMQRDLVPDVVDALTFVRVPLRADLVESLRDRLRQESLGFFSRRTGLRADPGCQQPGEANRPRCLLPSAEHKQMLDVVRRPGLDRTLGTRSLVTALLFFLAESRDTKNSPAVPRPISRKTIERTADTFERSYGHPDYSDPTAELKLAYLEQLKAIAREASVDLEQYGAILAYSLAAAETRGYRVLLYELPIWQFAAEDEDYARVREESREIVRLASSLSGVPWINRSHVNDKPEGFLYDDIIHPTLYGKLLNTVELAKAVGRYLESDGEAADP